jgi:hypothetical protein
MELGGIGTGITKAGYGTTCTTGTGGTSKLQLEVVV